MPSIKQTLLREPTRSYQSLYQDGQSRPNSQYAGSASSSYRRGPSSIRSSGSFNSYNSESQASTGPAWVNGQWEWSNFGGRKGLTGGAKSLYTPSVVGRSIGASKPNRDSTMSLRSERLRSDDGGSIRSERSTGRESLRSTMSLPNGDHRRTRSSSRDILQAVEAVGRPSTESASSSSRRNRTQSANAATSQSQSSQSLSQSQSSRRNYDNLPSISSSFDHQQTSRRYASAPISTSASSSRPSSVAPISSRPGRSKSPLRHASDEHAPSLTSSASSAPSSGPVTPVQSHPNLASPLSIDAGKALPRKAYTSPETVLATTSEPVVQEEQTPPAEQDPSSAADEEEAPKRFYSVDEFFAIAGTSKEDSPSSDSTTVPEANVRSHTESDNMSFMTANDGHPPSPVTLNEKPSVPRLKLTRTESDQSRAGIKGAVDLSESEEEDDRVVEGAPMLAPIQQATPEEEQEEEEEQPRDSISSAPEVPANAEESQQNEANVDGKEEPTYEVIRSSSAPRRSASTPAASSLASDDQSESPSYASSMTSVSQVDSTTAASVDVPDWLQRIRALGEPIETLQPRIPPSNKKKLTPPPHWTVLQLRAQEQKTANRPNMNRPRSVGSLRTRKSPMYGLPDVAEEEEPPVPSFPAWLPKKVGQDGTLVSPPRGLSPSPNGSLERSTSTHSSNSGSTHRRSRSMDLAPMGPSSISSLQRTTSLSTTPVSRTSSRPSSVHSTDTTGSKKLKGLSKLLQPPLASSKAVREEPEPEPAPRRTEPVYTPSSRYYSAPSRTSSLREALAQRDGPSSHLSANRRTDDDANSSYGGSQISMMSAPQLSPVRPSKNPARRSSLSVSTSGNALQSSTARSNSEERRSSRPSSINYSPVSRPPSRPASIVGAGTQERRPPPPAAPIFASSSQPPSRAASLSSGRLSSRPLSSYLPPSADVEMSSLAISPRLDVAKKTSKRFSLFRSSSNANTSSTRRFDPSLDLLYERLDVTSQHKRLRSDEVLVESIAVGLDRWDIEKTWSTANTTSGAGYVPGRAVYGKVLARGESVSKVKKGDLVWGLTTLKKSSTLAALVTLDRDNVSLAPPVDDHTMDQIAALPADAVAAMQVMETYAKELPKGSKILVLNAHQGIGYLCLQLAKYLRPSGGASNRDLWVVAQIPMSVIDSDSLCREAGATDVVRDEPLAAINGLHEGSFDVVIDTIGGRRLYDASRRILHNSGSFVTTAGDSLGSDSSSAPPSSYQTSLRSLRRTFFKKDKKSVHYWLASHEVDEREAVRDLLDKVREAVEAGALRAKVDQVYSFADARLAFSEKEAKDGAGAVIRIKELA
ncbi:uncharacterized protein JCM6883_000376 [Sporobolomyces salmoneus]|uniref:uncharacterized protein n=1 Tax=Sporobolomyces salmoneus TaxID=183962 RepID=UPI003177D256